MSQDDLSVLPLSGFRDFLPAEQAARSWLIGQALEVYRQFGYFPIETPALERNEIFSGQYGEEGEKLRYRFEDHGKRQVGMRYDLTVPFARYIARFVPSGEVQLPFRRSQVAPVWRADSPQNGRYREFYQCDADLAGSSDPSADAEIVLMAHSLLGRLGCQFRVRVSHRGVADAFLRSLEIAPEAAKRVLIILDKMDKVDRSGIRGMLLEDAGLSAEQTDHLLDAVTNGAEGQAPPLPLDEAGQKAWEELRAILVLAREAAGADAPIVTDLSVIRGLSYYTGLVVETTVAGAEQFGSILGGGRYDHAVGAFIGRDIPAVGVSLGVDRCLAALHSLNLVPEAGARADAAVLAFPECQEAGFALAARLRQAGASVVTYPGSGKLGEMLGFATRTACYAVIVGSEEVASGRYQVKELDTRQQSTQSEEELVAALLGR